jgi:hypothetical protein
MKDLLSLIESLESKIEFFEATKQLVSKSTVGWQIDHSLRVVNGIIETLKKSNPSSYKWNFNFKRIVVFTIRSIPRGKANAPKTVRTYDEIKKQDLINQIEISKKLISELVTLHKKNNFQHPYFGKLNLKQSVKFLEIHTNHHLNIVNDILA